MTVNPVGGNELELKVARLEGELAALQRSMGEILSTVGPRTDLPGGWGPRVRIGLVDDGRYGGEVLTDAGVAGSFPKYIGEPFFWIDTTPEPPLARWANGQALKQDDFPEAFDFFGTTFDTFRGQSAPASDEFRLPKYDGLTIVCYDAGDGSFDSLTDTGGSKDAIVVTHTHPASGGSLAVSAGQGNHDHDVTTGTVQSGVGATVPTVTAGATDTPDATLPSLSVDTGSTGSAGSSGTGANMQPYGVMRIAIFVGR